MSAELAIGVITFFAGVVALYFARQQSNTEIESAVHSAFLAIGEVFFEYPALRPHFYENEALDQGVADLETADQYRANALAELTLDTFELTLGSRRARRMYGPYLGSAFRNSAFLSQWALDHADFYVDQLVALAAEAMAIKEEATAQGGS